MLRQIRLGHSHIKKNADSKLSVSNYTLLHLLDAKTNKTDADKLLLSVAKDIKNIPEQNYCEYKLGKISLGEYKTRQASSPVLSVKFNFTIGFEAMQKGEKEKAIEHFKKCLIPYSIDLPEYHMAKACLKRLEK